jgi:hypothetical protein
MYIFWQDAYFWRDAYFWQDASFGQDFGIHLRALVSMACSWGVVLVHRRAGDMSALRVGCGRGTGFVIATGPGISSRLARV